MNSFRGSIPRISALLRKKPFPIPSPGPHLPPDILIDEEISPVYNSKHFYPVKPGEVLADRYQTLIKVGWGVSSTVWLARDLQVHIEEPENIVTIKIANKNANLTGHERDVEEHISTADPSHRGRSVYQSRSDFGPLKGLQSIPKLVDFGLATRLPENDDWGVWPIQPDPYRAPEVILGNRWQMEADIWNFGVLMWDMIAGKELFQHFYDQEGRYDPKLHIAEMIALLGNPPPEIRKRYHVMREYPWPHPVTREDGTVCETAEEVFCGPFFDSNDDAVPFLEGEEKELFLDLARGMLVWHSQFTKTAGDLAEHPFLKLNRTCT
ncbi:uncharacterized protein N7483_001248 [Penicillium malachiteum]|uniref:uncharacterized protein n=1 Tax=Penicillium malachiteum TaxID=1324776 RepID=UPI002549158B|nr:uncharacterized protein N7483_001248 [Penicillium malachiteum]KAJ5736123.1 hypothetical protein N7483_001248 [Penicillium malachiteum]